MAKRSISAILFLDCYVADGAGYRGKKATTESGQICQNWASHQHAHNPQK